MALPADIQGLRSLSVTPFATRWQPVDIRCTGGVDVRTKLVRLERPSTAAVCISEAIAIEVLRVIGLRVATCHAVTVDSDFAADMSSQFAFNPPILAGRHWGTTVMTATVQEVEFSADDVRLLRAPQELMTLFIGDVVLANPDRRTHGNVLLHQSASPRMFDLLPIDQSDCFNHPDRLRSPAALEEDRNKRIAAWLPGTEVAILGLPASFTAHEVARVQGLKPAICAAAKCVPDEWYERASVQPDSLVDFLSWRVDHLGALVDIQYWQQLHGAVGGGHVIEF